MRVAFIVYLDFLDAHGGYYTTTIYIHVHSFFAIQFNFRKTPLFVLHVESHKFLLLVSSWIIVIVATTVAGGCVCWCCRRELALLQEGVSVMLTNRARKQVSNLTHFSLSRFHFLSWSYRVEKKTKKNFSCSIVASSFQQQHHATTTPRSNNAIVAVAPRSSSNPARQQRHRCNSAAQHQRHHYNSTTQQQCHKTTVP